MPGPFRILTSAALPTFGQAHQALTGDANFPAATGDIGVNMQSGAAWNEGMDPQEKSLRLNVEWSEAEIARQVRSLAALIHCPLTRKEKAALRQGLKELATLRDIHSMRVNQYRQWRPGGVLPIVPVAVPAPVAQATTLVGQKPPVPRAQFLKDQDERTLKLGRAVEGITWMLSQRKRPFYVAPPRKPDVQAEQLAASDRVFRALHWVVNSADQDAKSAELGCFPDIPLMPSVFLAHAHAALRVGYAQRRARMRFLDVGCGGGVKVMLAAEIFTEADGLEYDPGYVACAEKALKLTGAKRARVFQADALGFLGYGDYDVIYFYQPMQRVEELIRLEQRIVEMAAPGTILIAPYRQFAIRAAELGCGHVAGAVYVTATGPQAASDLCTKAERTGTSLVDPLLRHTDQEQRDSYLALLIATAQRIGHDIT